MLEIDNDAALPSCCHLFFRPGIQEFQMLAPDPYCLVRVTGAGRFSMGSSGNPRGISNC
jgi:hypothetical protein